MPILVGQIFYNPVSFKALAVPYLKKFYSNAQQYSTIGSEQENKKTLRLLKKPDKDIRFRL